jgi:predicted hydrocarbon binding protein
MTSPTPPTLAATQCLALGRRALHQLRTTLERETGLQAATWLQEAGFAAGDDLYQAFGEWTAAEYGLTRPDTLDQARLGEVLGAFFEGLGWGGIRVSRLAPSILAFDADDWAEAQPGAEGQYPSCHVTSGMLAAFVSQLAGSPAAAMEVECRTRGEGRCRWLVGSPESLGTLYDMLSRGIGYQQALTAGGVA